MKISEVVPALLALKDSDPEVYICFSQSSYIFTHVDVNYEGKVDTITFDGKDGVVRLYTDRVNRVK